jgi:hypothetical protein
LNLLGIAKYIEQLDEDRFRRLIYGFFVSQGILTHITHGRLESGADIVLVMKQSQETLQRGQIFYFQVKSGKINTKIWREGLHSELMELFDRPLRLAMPISDDNVSKRIILITNSSINQDVISKIQNFNRKHYLPIETITGMEFSQLLLHHDSTLTIEKIEELSNTKYPGETN